MTAPNSPTLSWPCRGFTIVELMVTLAILVILATIGVPMFTSGITRAGMDSAISDMAASLAVARSEAISRSQRVVICKSAAPDVAEASLACGGGDDAWNDGWIVFADADSDGVYDAGETVIRRRGPVNNVAITTGGHYTTRVTYGTVGRPTQNDTFTFTPSASSGLAARTITVSSSGRVTISQ